MHMEEPGRPGRLREQPPRWPRREKDFIPEPRRWLREPDPYEDDNERYPGARIFDDVADSDDDVGYLHILARYAVARVLLLSAAGVLSHARLRVERRIAAEHLALLPRHDWERHLLERLNGLCRETPPPSLVTTAIAAAEAAAKRGQYRGAYTLYRAGYDAATRRGWWAEAASAAGGVSRLARLDEAHYSARLWGRRARVLEARDRRAGGGGAAPG